METVLWRVTCYYSRLPNRANNLLVHLLLLTIHVAFLLPILIFIIVRFEKLGFEIFLEVESFIATFWMIYPDPISSPKVGPKVSNTDIPLLTWNFNLDVFKNSHRVLILLHKFRSKIVKFSFIILYSFERISSVTLCNQFSIMFSLK